MFWSLGSACVACFYFRDAFTDDSQERSSSASCQWASKRHILCQSGWSDNTGSRELEGVSHYFGYMVFQQLYWMIMLLSHDIRNHIGHQECFLVGTYCAWTSIIEELEIFRWQAGKIHNRKTKTWVSESGDCASEQWTEIWSNFGYGVFEGPFSFTAFVMPV